MSSKRKEISILIGLIVLLISINYNYLDKSLENFISDKETKVVERVIDGDTIVVSGNEHIRLLGINSPEKGEKYYNEAKKFLNDELINKTISLEFSPERYDLYNRSLGYIFLDERNINLEIIKNGLGNYYFPTKTDYNYKKFKTTWENCLKENKNLCKKSENKCSECLELKEFNIKNQSIILYNKCTYSCNLSGWSIKDEGRKKFKFPNFILEKNKEVKIIVDKENRKNNENEIFWPNKEYVWTKTGDSIFIRDTENNLVLWEDTRDIQ